MFFSPIVTKIGDKPFICYVDTDLVKHPDGITETSVHDRIEVFGQNWRYFSVSGRKTTEFVPEDTDFMIGFLWTDGQKIYVDVWIQRQLSTYGKCAPMTTLQSFDSQGFLLNPWEKGNACGDTRIVSGREEEYRRKVMSSGGSMNDYIYGDRPEMPNGLIIPWPNPSD